MGAHALFNKSFRRLGDIRGKIVFSESSLMWRGAQSPSFRREDLARFAEIDESHARCMRKSRVSVNIAQMQTVVSISESHAKETRHSPRELENVIEVKFNIKAFSLVRARLSRGCIGDEDRLVTGIHVANRVESVHVRDISMEDSSDSFKFQIFQMTPPSTIAAVAPVGITILHRVQSRRTKQRTCR